MPIVIWDSGEKFGEHRACISIMPLWIPTMCKKDISVITIRCDPENNKGPAASNYLS